MDGPLPEPPPTAVLGCRAAVDRDGWVPLSAVMDALGGPERRRAADLEELDVDRGW